MSPQPLRNQKRWADPISSGAAWDLAAPGALNRPCHLKLRELESGISSDTGRRCSIWVCYCAALASGRISLLIA
jgi:hypothetical protein